MLVAECPAPTTRTCRPATPFPVAAQDVGRRAEEERGGLDLAGGGQAGGAERVAPGPRARGVQDRPGVVVRHPPVDQRADQERSFLAAGAVRLVRPDPADRDDPGAGDDPPAQLRRGRQRLQVLRDELAPCGQPVVAGGFPAGTLEQPPGGAVDVVLQGREQPDVRPVPDRRPHMVTRLQYERLEAALEQVRCGGQADGAGTDHDDGQRVERTDRLGHRCLHGSTDRWV